jgi:TolA-binding protein
MSPGSEPPPGDPSATAAQARESLREEIEQVRSDVAGMVTEQSNGEDVPRGRIGHLEQRLLRLEGRIDQLEQERRYAEWRMYSNVERLLDDVLRDIRSIADRLTR